MTHHEETIRFCPIFLTLNVEDIIFHLTRQVLNLYNFSPCFCSIFRKSPSRDPRIEKNRFSKRKACIVYLGNLDQTNEGINQFAKSPPQSPSPGWLENLRKILFRVLFAEFIEENRSSFGLKVSKRGLKLACWCLIFYFFPLEHGKEFFLKIY